MKNNLKNSIYGAVGFIIPLVISLITAPYIVHKLTAEIYGIYVLSTSLIGLMSFLDLGFGQGIIKFVSEYEAKKDYESIKKVLGVSFYIYFFMGVIGGVIIFFFSDSLVSLFNVSENFKGLAKFVFKIVSIGFLINFITNVFLPIPKALQRYDISTKIDAILWILFNISMVGLIYFRFALKEIIILSLLFNIIKLIAYFVIYKKILQGISFQINFDKKIFKKIFSFSFYTAINSITGNLVFRVDKMIISGFLGTSAVTYYTIPFMMIQMGFGLISAMTQFIFPATSYLSSTGDTEKIREIYKKAVRYTSIISSVFTSGFIVLGGIFLTLWMGKDFAQNAKELIPIISMIFFFQSVSVPGFNIYNGLGYSKINMISSFIGSTAYLLAALILIQSLKLKGAALSFGFTLLPFPFYFYYLHKIINQKQMEIVSIMFRSLILVVIGIFLKFLLVNFILIKFTNDITNLIFTGFILMIVLLISMKIFNLMDKNEIIKMVKGG